MLERWVWYVYIIECLNHRYYTGCTTDVLYRYEQHLHGEGSKYTQKYGVRDLVYKEEYETLEEAWQRERQVKGWSQAKKRKLIKGEWGQW